MTVTASRTQVTYTIEPGLLGKIVLFIAGKRVASRIKATVMRSFTADQLKASEEYGRFWEWLGITVDWLPRGVTTKDIATAYMVARDEMIEGGYELPDSMR